MNYRENIRFYKFLDVKIRIRERPFVGDWVAEYQRKTFWGKKWVPLNRQGCENKLYSFNTLIAAKEDVVKILTLNLS